MEVALMNQLAKHAADERYPYRPDQVLPPGETLRETLEALDMTQTQLAQRTGLSGKHINQIIQGQSALTHETAISLERATGIPSRLWNSLESQYRDYMSRIRERESLDKQVEWLERMPLKALRKLGHVTATARERGKQLQQVLSFFGVATVEAWEEVWGQPSAAFLQSAAFSADAGAVAAWLRIGEIEATRIYCQPYDRARLRSILPRLRELTLLPASEIYPRLRELCASAGVAVVLAPEVTGARASGATRWISPNKAIVQLSNRGKRNDKFWFALFHEIAHVLLHGKRDVFVEHDLGHDGGRPQQESEANDFAGHLLIPEFFEPELATLETDSDVEAFARQIAVAPGIVAGRLQHDRQDYRFGYKLFEKYELIQDG